LTEKVLDSEDNKIVSEIIEGWSQRIYRRKLHLHEALPLQDEKIYTFVSQGRGS